MVFGKLTTFLEVGHFSNCRFSFYFSGVRCSATTCSTPVSTARTSWTSESGKTTEIRLLVLMGLRSQPREDSNISPAQAVYGAPMVLPNQFLSIDDNETMNKFLVQINNILNNSSLPRHNVAADRELPEDLPPDFGPRTASGYWRRFRRRSRCSDVGF